MDSLTRENGTIVSASVWEDGQGFHVKIDFYNAKMVARQTIEHVVPGNKAAVRELIAREVSRHGFDLEACAISWKLG